MNRATADQEGGMEKRHEAAPAHVRGTVLGPAFFAAGIVLSALWFMRAPAPSPAAVENDGPPALSTATKAVLQHLGSPVEIRFYSLLDPATIGDSGREFSGRVDQLLSRYELEDGGKIKVARVNVISTATANAAAADGIKPFNMDKGDACYLGLAVVCNGQKQVLSSLAPEWESALESDISRTIADVAASDVRAQPPSRPADLASVEAVKRVMPNIDSVSVEEGSRMLRVAALTQFKKTAQEMQARVKEAEDRFIQAQNNQSESEQEAALKDLQQVQTEQTEKLREIALASKAQLQTLQQIKGAPH